MFSQFPLSGFRVRGKSFPSSLLFPSRHFDSSSVHFYVAKCWPLIELILSTVAKVVFYVAVISMFLVFHNI